VLAVKEDIGYVVAVLQSGKGGVCRECYQILDEAWANLCPDCCRNRHRGVDADPEDVHKYANEHQVDHIRAELAIDDAAAEEAYRDMLAQPESVVDGSEIFS
jgi:hypothetical protein